MKSRLNFTYKVTRNDKVVAKGQTHFIRRFYNRIRSIKWQDVQSVYLRVNYGNGFHNDGDYQSKRELLEALDAFTER